MKHSLQKDTHMNQNNLPDLTIVKGVVCMALGIMLVAFATSIIIRMTCFVAGLGFIYIGLRMLNIPGLNNRFSLIRSYCQKFFS